MALNVETLKQNEGLAKLGDDVLTTIATMSKNDETQVVNSIYSKYDSQLGTISGSAKEAGESSEDYHKRVLTSYSEQVKGTPQMKQDLEKAQATITDLKKKIESNTGDEELRKELGDTKSKLEAITKERDDNKVAYEAKAKEYESQLFEVKAKGVFDSAVAGLKFKAGYPETVQKALKDQAYKDVKSYGKMGLDKDGNIEFRNEQGQILLNPNNNNEPMRIADVVMTTALKDVIETSPQQAGGGTHPTPVGGNGIPRIAGRTQIEVDENIKAYLMSQGISVTSPDYQKRFSEIRKENKVK